MNPKELLVIKEEEEKLRKLLLLQRSFAVTDNRETYLAQVLELREALSEAKEDDVPHLTEQINNLIHLINQTELADAYGFNPLNPYFARLVLEEEDRVRDLYIGTQVFSNKELGVQIVDWKASPVAALYFRYSQGDEYEEEIGGRLSEGRVKLKRVFKIHDGELVQIEAQGLHLFKEKGHWRKGHARAYLLKGGSGTASRAEKAKTQVSPSGVTHKLLPEITALIDPEQFELITKPETGILAIQGTAGSGKTTVALHRVAWLHRKDPKRFSTDKMLVMVFSRALAKYISLVLPSLGVEGVEIASFEEWASEVRVKLFGHLLPKGYAEDSPAAVIRLKKHPALLFLMDRFINEKTSALEEGLEKIVESKELDGFLFEALAGKTFLDKLVLLRDWTQEEGAKLEGKTFCYSGEVKVMLWKLVEGLVEDPFRSKKLLLLQLWDELFSDFERIRATFLKEAKAELPPATLEEGINWIRQQYLARHNWLHAKGEESKDPEAGAAEASLDYEDDPILLYLWSRLSGPLEGPKKAALSYAHLFVDEAQDLSLVEHKVLVSICADPLSLTFAGDINQQMIQHNAFKGWKYLFANLGLPGQEINDLKVSYRSTRQIMEFSLGLLGDLASTHDVKTVKEGPTVELFSFAHQGELCHSLSQSLKDLIFGEANASIALITLTPEGAKTYYDLLEPMDIPRLRLVDDQNFSFTPGIDITDVREVKGLEFDYVILLDVDAVNYPDNSYQRYLLHIAATRAAHQLWILNYRVPSPLLPPELLDRVVR